MHWVEHNWAFREKGIHPAGVEQGVGTPEVFIQSKCVKGFGGSQEAGAAAPTEWAPQTGAELLRESWCGG